MPSTLTFNEGTDQKIIDIPDPAQCCQLCGNSTGCVAWSWEEYNSHTSGKCWLTHGAPGAPLEHSGSR